MAITATHITTDGTDSNNTSYNSSAFAPAANELVVVTCNGAVNSGTLSVDPALSGGGLGSGWNMISSRLADGTNVHGFWTFWGLSSSPGSSAALNFLLTGQTMTYFHWSIGKYAGVDPTTPIIVANIDDDVLTGVTNVPLTLPNAFGHADNGVYMGCASPNNRTYSVPGSSVVLFGQEGKAGAGSITSGYVLGNDSNPDITLSASSTAFGRAFEIKAAVAASGSGLWTPKRRRQRALVVR